MKPLVIALATLFLVLQYKLWFEKGSVTEVSRLRQAIAVQNEQNDALSAHNKVFIAEIQNLKSGQAAVEERARNDLGMIKSGEVFYQLVEPSVGATDGHP